MVPESNASLPQPSLRRSYALASMSTHPPLVQLSNSPDTPPTTFGASQWFPRMPMQRPVSPVAPGVSIAPGLSACGMNQSHGGMHQPAAAVEASGNALPDLSSPEESATHASVHSSGIILVCGVRRRFIRVLQPNGQFKCDMPLTCVGQLPPVRNLAATAVDLSNGNIYVCDSEAGAVYCISDEGAVLAFSPAGAVTHPLGLSLCAHSRRLAVADATSVRILHADSLSLIKTIAFVRWPGGCIQFSHCKGVAFDADGFLYVVDSGSDTVIVFDPFYVFINSFGGRGSYDGQFYGAHGICIDSTGKVFVSDSTRVQMFTRSGWHILSLVPALLDPQLAWSQLAGISLDDRGRLLVCSPGTGSLLRIL